MKQILRALYNKIKIGTYKAGIISNLVKGYIHRKELFDLHKCKAFILLDPATGNLGDQAIMEETQLILRELLPEYMQIPIELLNTYYYIPAMKHSIRKDDYVFFIGGGNMGDLYPEAEWVRRFVIKRFRNNRIISLPQSICFTNSLRGRLELKKSIRAYSNKKNLTMMLRDETSFKFAQKYFDGISLKLVPDTVYAMKLPEDDIVRQHIIVCVRDDQESAIGNKKNYIIAEASKFDSHVYIYDNVLLRHVFDETRHEELLSVFTIFKEACLVITDRLHGMIFSVITHTPCVAVCNDGSKIYGSYEWIKKCGYIECVSQDKLSDLKEAIEKVMHSEKNNGIIETVGKQVVNAVRESL